MRLSRILKLRPRSTLGLVALATILVGNQPGSSEAATPQAPKGSVSGPDVKFQWQGDRSENRFLIRIKEGSRIVDVTSRKASVVGCAGGGTCNLTLGLNPGSYQWQVKKHPNGRWSNDVAFTVGSNGSSRGSSKDDDNNAGGNGNNAAGGDNGVGGNNGAGDGPGILIGPVGAVPSGDITFLWEGDRSADKYLIRIRQGNSTKKAARRTAKAYKCSDGGTCSYRVSLGNGTFDWDVQPYVNGRSQKRSPKARIVVGSAGSETNGDNGGGDDHSDSSGGGNDGNIGTVPLKGGSNNGPFAGAYKTSPSEFERMTGTPIRIDKMFLGWRDGWAPLEGNSDWVLRNISRAQGSSKVLWHLSHPLMPKVKGDGGTGAKANRGRLQKCSAGQYNQHYRKLAANLKKRNIKNMIIRPGWEFTILGFPYGTGNRGNNVDEAKLYAECFRQFVKTLRSNYDPKGILIEWNMHQEVSANIRNAAYPGNQYIDIIGFDWYDVWGNQRNSCERSATCRWNKRFLPILKNMRSFANSKGKPMAISEMGVWTNSSHKDRQYGLGDNAHWIENTCKWIKSNNFAYYIYFDQSNTAHGGHKHALKDHPKSLNAYRKYCIGNSGNPSAALTR